MKRARAKPQLDLFGAVALEPEATPASPAALLEEKPAALRRIPDWVTDHGAHFSDDKVYRYLLWRAWGPGPRALFLLHNPSKASAKWDDATIGTLYGFTKAASCDGFYVANAFDFCATDPKDLWNARWDLRVGPEADARITAAIAGAAGVLVVGWGRLQPPAKNRELARARVQHVLELINEAGRQPMCLGTNADGSPRHPLYLPATTKLEPYNGGTHGRDSDEDD